MTLPDIRAIRSPIVAGLVAACLLAPGHSFAQSVAAYASVNLNQRAGPGTRFPVIVVAPVRTPVTLFGCLSDLSWCDGAYQGNRGWFSARYLQLPYQGSYLTVRDYVRYAYLPVVSFNIASYWASYYYPRQPFYAQISLYTSGGSVAVSLGSFYEPLSPHGSWVQATSATFGCRASRGTGAPTPTAAGPTPEPVAGCGSPTSRSAGQPITMEGGPIRNDWLVLGSWNAVGAGVGRLAAVRRLSRLGAPAT